MARIIVPTLVIAVLSLAVAFGGDGKTTRHRVTITDMKFDPAMLEIATGDTVIWTNQDDRDHTVAATDSSFKSDNLNRGGAFQQVFTKPGKFSYSCGYHPRMKGTIVVKEQ